jgi:hypothetical protein
VATGIAAALERDEIDGKIRYEKVKAATAWRNRPATMAGGLTRRVQFNALSPYPLAFASLRSLLLFRMERALHAIRRSASRFYPG